MFFILTFSFVFFFMIFFSAKFVCLLSMEIYGVFLISYFYSYSHLYSYSFIYLILMSVMMVLDSVFSLTILVDSNRSPTSVMNSFDQF